MEVFAEISEDSPDKIVVEIPGMYQELMKSIPGAKYDPNAKNAKNLVFTLPLTYPGVRALFGTFKHEVTLGLKLEKWYADIWNSRFGLSMALRDVVHAEGYPDLYPYQNAGVRFLSTAKRAILADGLGSGKTRTALATMRRLYEMGENPFPLLVVAPNSTKISWSREVEKVWPGLNVVIVSGTASQRRKQFKEFKESGHILVMNWEALKGHSRLAPYGNVALVKCTACGGVDEKITPAKCHAHPKELNDIDFNMVIADEAHRMKSGSAQQTRALKAATGNAEYRLALTGTPIANAQDDLWSILNWLYPEAFPSKVKFIDRYLITSINAYNAVSVVGIKPHMEAEFFSIVDPILRRMPKEVVLPYLPPVVFERRDVEMEPKQKKAYEQMRDFMVAELDGGDMVVTESPLTKMRRLLQFASSYAETYEVEVKNPKTGEMEKKTKVKLILPSNKVNAFMDDIEGFGDESIIIFSPSKQLINLLAGKMEKAGYRFGRITGDEDNIERQIHMDNFQNGITQFILCTTGAGGTGITLTKASTAVYLGRPWSNIESEQSEGRNHRLGSEIHDKITYIDYVSIGTIEEAVFEALENKSNQLQTILRDKDLMKKVLETNHIPEGTPETEEPSEEEQEEQDDEDE